jgi:class 3 adenylate cyclase/CHASE2 domain-containing sensor protein
VQFKRPKRAPIFLALGVLALVCGVRTWNPDFLDRLERMTYDWRVRSAQRFPAPIASHLAFVSMEDSSIAAVNAGKVDGLKLGYHSGLYWQRQIYGRLIEELAAQGAKTVAFDILFGELRSDHPPVQMADGSLIESDDFFALKMQRAGNVITAFTPDVSPPELFATNSFALGDISTEKDSDGVLRQVESFNLKWNAGFKSVAKQFGVSLDRAQIQPDRIILPQSAGHEIIVMLDTNGDFDLADFVGDKIPKGRKRYDNPFVRVWDMGIVIAAQELQLDLAHAEIDLPHGRIRLHGANGIQRTIPVDARGNFYIDWRITPTNTNLLRAPIENLLKQDKLRSRDGTNSLPDYFHDKLVIVGSAAKGNDLTDRGATPLENDTLLVSKHWNVANSIITGEFIHRTPLAWEFVLIIFLGALTAILTWQSRVFVAASGAILVALIYGAVAFFAFVKFRFWLPVIYPVAGAMLMEYLILAAHRVMFEEGEKRRVKSVFSKLVSPHVVNELLGAEKLALGGAHREITIFFADVRGFTTLTDQIQEQVVAFVRNRKLDSTTAEKYLEESARETLETVNLYLATVAEAVKKHGGTLDKYIGDCVMAFWNAPSTNEKHALACVQAAIETQRAIVKLNAQRLAQNPARETENRARLAAGLPQKPLHVELHLGSGVNTGFVTVGLMGSDEHGFNYTVFGRDVNLASRLEGVSGSGRIIISDTTYLHLLHHAPEIAATCRELPPEQIKGFRDAVRIYEVPWK